MNMYTEYVELIEIINEIIIVASSWLFILLYQRCTVTQTSNLRIIHSTQIALCGELALGGAINLS